MKDIYRPLKEAEHILNVTIKNNRSLETILEFLKKLTEFYDEIITDYLKDKQIEVPIAPIQRAKYISKLFNDEGFVKEIIDEYLILRKAIRSKVTIQNEHRRNIEAIFEMTEGEFRVNQKIMKELLENAKSFLEFLKSLDE